MTEADLDQLAKSAAIFMSGPPEAVAKDAYTDGVWPWWRNLLPLEDGHILVGKCRDASVVFRVQYKDGVYTRLD